MRRLPPLLRPWHMTANVAQPKYVSPPQTLENAKARGERAHKLIAVKLSFRPSHDELRCERAHSFTLVSTAYTLTAPSIHAPACVRNSRFPLETACGLRCPAPKFFKRMTEFMNSDHGHGGSGPTSR
eukprot:4284661-Prymnesium_polylepis.1